MIDELLQVPELRKAFPSAAAFGLMFLQEVYSGIALNKFGTRNVNVDQVFWTVDATLEWVAGILKKRKVVDLVAGKGGPNVELLELIRTIRAHQIRKLWPKELKQALEYNVSDEEALRLFEWRANQLIRIWTGLPCVIGRGR